MDTREHMRYVHRLLEEAVKSNNWEAASRFTFLLYLLREDLISEQEILISYLRRAG